MSSKGISRQRLFVAAVVAFGLVAAACGGGNDDTSGQVTGTGARRRPLRRPVVTRSGSATSRTSHTRRRSSASRRGSSRSTSAGTKLETKTFNAGGDAVTALFGDSIDASYIGPNPAINAFQKSKGKAIRIISGATSGGAFLVTKKDDQRRRAT